MSTIQVRNINFEPTGNNRITYETSNGYFTIVLGGNRVLDYVSGNLNLIIDGFSTNVVTTNTFTSNVITSNNITSNTLTTNVITSNTSSTLRFASDTITGNTVNTVNLNMTGSFSTNGSFGTVNQVFSSQGPGLPPIWKDTSGTPDYIIMSQGVI
jgi:hypothetical protein